MHIMRLADITDDDIVSSSVPEDDYAEWDSGTTYAADEMVILTSTHRIYASVQAANTGNDPATDDGTWWTEVGRTAPYRPFDGVISSAVTTTDQAVFVIEPKSVVDTVSLFNMAASVVTLDVVTPRDPGAEYDWYSYWFEEPDGTLTASVTVQMLDVPTHIYDEWTLIFADLTGAAPREALLSGFQAMPGQQMILTIGAPGEVTEVGEILIGTSREYGTTIDGTESEIRSYSEVTTDVFGNVTIIERPSARPITFEFAYAIEDEGRVMRELTSLINRPAVFYDPDLIDRGLITYGLFSSVRTPHAPAGVTKLSIKVQAMI